MEDSEVIEKEYLDYLDKNPNHYMSVYNFQLDRLKNKFPKIYNKVKTLLSKEQALKAYIFMLQKEINETQNKLLEQSKALKKINKLVVGKKGPRTAFVYSNLVRVGIEIFQEILIF